MTKGIKGTTPQCIVPGCERMNHAHGYCGRCYMRLKKNGDPSISQYVRAIGTPMERFLSYAVRPSDEDECHGWRPALLRTGYATIRVDGKTHRAHRWIWEQTVGPIPEGMTLDHECHNEAAALGECGGGWDCPHRPCTNLRHLALKTLGENNWASPTFSGNRTHCPQGHPYVEGNIYWKKDGGKQCRECVLERSRLLAKKRGGQGQRKSGAT